MTILKYIRNRFHFFRYTGRIERICIFCGKKQINVIEIVYGGLKNNWKDLN